MPLTFAPGVSSTHLTYSNGNLTVTSPGTGWYAARVDVEPPSVPVYHEIRVDVTKLYYMVGGATAAASMETYLGASSASLALYGSGGALYRNGFQVGTIGPSHAFGTAGDIVGMAYNPSTAKVWFAVNGAWSGDPAAGTGEAFASVPAGLFASIALYETGSEMTALFNASEFTHTVPTGFSALGDYLPVPVVITPALLVPAFLGKEGYAVNAQHPKFMPPPIYTGDVLPYGDGYVSGTITEKGTPDIPVRRKVRLHNKLDGRAVATTWSNLDGTYEFRPVPLGEYYVVSFDHTNNFNAVIRDSIMAEPVT